MGEKCIFCNSREGSAEHVFPSSFGGRLKNNKIYCKKHNSDLAIYISILDKKIGNINNFLGISPDRGEAKPIKLEDQNTGTIYWRDIGGNITLSPIDNLDEDALLRGEPQTILLSSMNDFYEKIVPYFKKKDKVVKIIGRGEASSRKIEEPLITKIQFGGKDFFKATLYLLITFLAHYKRRSLNNIDLNVIYDILLGNKDESIEDIVSLGEHPPFLQDNEDQIMHSFAFIKQNDILYGIISYYNIVSYTVKIGEHHEEFDNFAVYVYPLNKSNNPNDGMVCETLSPDEVIGFHPELHKDTITSIRDGEIPIMDKLCKKLNRHQYNCLVEQCKKERNQQNELLRKGIGRCKTKDDLIIFLYKNKGLIHNYILTISDILVAANKLPKMIIDVINIDLFIDLLIEQICQILAQFYTEKTILENEDIIEEICICIFKIFYILADNGLLSINDNE